MTSIQAGQTLPKVPQKFPFDEAYHVHPDEKAAGVAAGLTAGIAHSNCVPAAVERHLSAIDFNQDGHLLLSSSALTGRHWTGSVWLYLDPAQAPQELKALTGQEVDNAVVEAKFFGHKTVILATDNGSLEVHQLSFSKETSSSSYYYLDRLHTIQEHDDLISGLALTSDHVLTVSFDRGINCLERNTLRKSREWANAHADLIFSVAANEKTPNVFATGANDGVVAMWDVREEKCQARIMKDLTKATALQFVANEENYLLAGHDSGEIRLFDVRKPGLVVSSIEKFPEQIHRIKFSPQRDTLFAVCGDSNIIEGFGISPSSELSLQHKDSKHTDFVRGLAFHPKTDDLWSCGWDKKVLSRELC